MSLRGKPLDQIEESDLQALVDNEVSERKYLEYKQCLPGSSDTEKKEFLADVTSFANAAGGHLIYGMREKDGVAAEVCGVSSTNKDHEKQRLESMMRDGVQPRIPGYALECVDLEKKGFLITIGIPRSWASPHRVTFKGHDKFYSRNSAGKYPMDVPELRAAFLLSETAAERIRNFREARLARIVAGETPVPLGDTPKIVLHVVPFGAFQPGTRVSSHVIAREAEDGSATFHRSMARRHNFDGFLVYVQFDPDSGPAERYAQIFRSGAVELADTRWAGQDGERRIKWQYEDFLRRALPDCLALQKRLGVEPPLFVMLSLLGVRGYTMRSPSPHEQAAPETPFDRDDLLVPESLVEAFECDVDDVLRPIFDAVCNAAGQPRSMNYDEKGKWNPSWPNHSGCGASG
jgi:hypothetical protein